MTRVWTASVNLNTARWYPSGCGTQSSALICGANNPMELFNGVSWVNGTSTYTARSAPATCGTTTAALSFGGWVGAGFSQVTTDIYDGNVWSAGGNLISARDRHGGCGTTGAALASGGYSPYNNSEEYNGVSWGASATINENFIVPTSYGTQSAGVIAGNGYSGDPLDWGHTSTYNGTSWAAGYNLIAARNSMGSGGVSGAGVVFGGYATGASSATEEDNGGTYSTSSNMNTPRELVCGAGTQGSALSFGGDNTSSASVVTEKYDTQVLAAPVANFSGTPTSGLAPLTVVFTDLSTNTPTTWDWDYGDGSTHGTTQNPMHVYSSAGTWTVTLTAENAYGSDEEIKVGYVITSSGVVPDTYIVTAGTNVRIFNPFLIEGGSPPTVYLTLYGWGYSIPSGTVLTLIVPYSATYLNVTTSGAGEELTLNNNVKVTRFALTSLPTGDYDFSDRGYCIAGKIFVNNISLYTSGTVTMLFGEESIGVTGSGTDTTYGGYFTFTATTRIMATGAKHYPHDVGCLVAKTNYTEAAPQTNSPYDLCGIYIDNRTVDGTITYGQLDTYATNLLLGLGNFYKKATTWGSLESIFVKHVGEVYGGLQQVSLSVPARTSDRISVTEYTGATPEEYQLVETTLICDEGRMLLNLGDFERNVFSTMQKRTAAINQPLT